MSQVERNRAASEKSENQEINQNGNASPFNKLVELAQPGMEEQVPGEIPGSEIKISSVGSKHSNPKKRRK